MAARIENLPPGRIGELGAGWTVELDAMPHSATQSSPSTGQVSFTAVADSDAHLVMNNTATFTFDDLDYEEVPDVLIGTSLATGGYGQGAYGAGAYGQAGSGGLDDSNVQVYEPPGALQITGQVTGTVDGASLQGDTGTFTHGTGFTQFVTRDMYVPPVTSGSPVAAFNLAYQLAGNQPCLLLPADRGGAYWSLRGHDAGFNWKNGLITPVDKTTYKLARDGQTLYRRWRVAGSYTSTGWAVADGEFWSTGGVGPSVQAAANYRSVIMATANLNGRSLTFQFGSSTSPDYLGFGPDDLTGSMGKWFSLSLHGPTAVATLDGQYRAGGNYVTISKKASLSGIDMTQPVQFMIDVGFPTTQQFTLTMYVQNVGSVAPPVLITTGLLNTKIDSYAAPWKVAGYLHGLYLKNAAYSDGYDPTSALVEYEDWSVQPTCDIDNFAIDSPILPFNGGLWDYLTQISIARQVGLRQVQDTFAMTAMSDDSQRAQEWHPAASPTFALDNSNVASTVEVDAQFASLAAGPQIYDALKTGDSYQITPGTTAAFSVTTASVNGLVYNPQPLADLTDFLNNSHPYGAYIVSGPDNLPIPVNEWVQYGGSVAVAQTGLNTLTVTVVCPVIPQITTTGDYFLGVSDGSTAHTLLRLSTPGGGAVTSRTMIYETGASYVSGNTTGPSVSNVAATNLGALQNTAAWAIADAAGPTLTMSGSFPLEDLRQWQTSDFGMIPGATLLYRNVQWRILTATISGVEVQFTAVPFTTYRSEYFDANWDGYSVDDFTAFWDGKTYDDMATMVLAGPTYDWDPTGAVARFSLFPGGGIAADDPGLDPATNLLPSEDLDPDSPGFDYTGIDIRGGVYPQPDLFPGSEEDPA